MANLLDFDAPSVVALCIGHHHYTNLFLVEYFFKIDDWLFPVKGYLRKAGCYMAMKDKTRALDAYQKALELDPNCEEAIDGCRR